MEKKRPQSNYPSNRLYELRKNANISTAILGKIAGISPTLINLLESGKRNFTEENAESIACALKVDKDLLLGVSNYGVWITDNSEQHTWQTISFSEYLQQRKLGNIKEIVLPRKATRLRDFNVDDSCTNPSESIEEEALTNMLAFERVYSRPTANVEFLNATKEQIFSEVAKMDESQLSKTLLIIKEVILK